MADILAENYLLRSDLESVVIAEFGTDINENLKSAFRIKGTREQLERLHLTDLTTIHGIRCQITDTPSKEIIEAKMDNIN